MRDERELGQDQAERPGDEELEPRVAQEHEPGDGAAEREREDPEGPQVVGVRAAEQAASRTVRDSAL